MTSMAMGGAALSAEPLKVSVQVATQGKLYVGQAIEVRVEVQGASGPWKLAPPRPSATDAEVFQLSGMRFVVVPRRPGRLVVPPFRAVSGDRSGSSRSTRLTVENLPMSGRTSSFLGGVGPFEVRAEGEPSRLRLGESLEYRVVTTGPAAWGIDRTPGLVEWASAVPGSKVEPLPGNLEPGDPATRTIRYRVRPGRAGRWVLPPLTVAGFDPKVGRYLSKVAPGVPIEVEDIPRFDPARIDFGSVRSVDHRVRVRWWAGIALGIVVILSGSAGWIIWRRGRSRRRPGPRRLALELGLGLVEGIDEAEMARRLVEALATFLQRVGGRPPGVLTPPEARADVEHLTLDPALAGDAERLVEDCDRVRFGGFDGESGRLRARGRALLERIGEASAGRVVGGRPKEAVWTEKS